MKTASRQVIQAGLFIGLVGACYFFGQWQRSHDDHDRKILAQAELKKIPLESSPPSPPTQDSSATQALVAKLMNEAGPFDRTDPADLKKIASALSQLAKIDPQLVLNYLAKLTSGNGPLGLDDYLAILRTVGPSDPTVWKKIAGLMPAGAGQTRGGGGLVENWLRTDPQAALDLYASFQPNQPLVIPTLWLRIIASNSPQPLLAAQYISTIQDEATRNAAIAVIAPLLVGTHANPAATLDWLNQVATGDTYSKAVTAVVAGLARNNPAAAAGALNEITDPALLQASIVTVASGWGKTDPQAALTWAQTLPDADVTTQASALNSIVTSWSKNDASAVVAYVQNSANPSLFLPADPAIAQSMATSNPQAALAFSNSLPDGSAKNQALNNVLTTEAQTDFATAWNQASSLPAIDNPDGAMASLVGVQANKDPAQAAALIPLLPDETGQAAATTTLAAIWLKLDPKAFTVWLNGLAPGGPRDDAIAQLAASAQASKNPAGVLAWVNTVSNPQTKAALVQKLTPAQTVNGP